MTTIQKAKELLERWDAYFPNAPVDKLKYEDFLATPEAAALLLGEDWISVKDRLPDYGIDVLIYKEHHKRFVIGHRTSTSSVGEHWSCDYEHYVTHWQPLPEPPKP